MPFQLTSTGRPPEIFAGITLARSAAHQLGDFEIWSGRFECGRQGEDPCWVNDRRVDSCVIEDAGNESIVGAAAKLASLIAIFLICWSATGNASPISQPAQRDDILLYMIGVGIVGLALYGWRQSVKGRGR